MEDKNLPPWLQPPKKEPLPPLTLDEFLIHLKSDLTWIEGFGFGIKGLSEESAKALDNRVRSIRTNINRLKPKEQP